jgi:hypothetical protein
MSMLPLFATILLAAVCCGYAFQHNYLTPRSYNSGAFSATKLSSANSEIEDLVGKVKEATPSGKVVVIKYGGHAMENEELKQFFCEDIAALCRTGVLPVIVHGGGPQIKKTLESLSIKSQFVQGLRVTDEKTMEVAQMVLCGSINKGLCGMLSSQNGVRGAVGLSGLDGKLIKAKKMKKVITDETGKEVEADLGLVGDPTTVTVDLVSFKRVLLILSQSLIINLSPSFFTYHVVEGSACPEARARDRTHWLQ